MRERIRLVSGSVVAAVMLIVFNVLATGGPVLCQVPGATPQSIPYQCMCGEWILGCWPCWLGSVVTAGTAIVGAVVP